MSGNLWHCDKSIKWLANWIKQSNVQFYSSYNIRCFTPASIQFKPLMMLTDSDFDSSLLINSTSRVQESTSTMSISFPKSSIPSAAFTLPSTGTIEKENVTLSSESVSNTSLNTSWTYKKHFDELNETVLDNNDTNSSLLQSPSQTEEKVETVRPNMIHASGQIHTMLPRISENPHALYHPKSINTSIQGHSVTYSSVQNTPRSSANISTDVILLHRRMMSSRLTGTPYGWDNVATIVILTGTCFLFIIVGCHLRYRHRNVTVRRDSISYYPQKDEVSILTEGARPHHVLGNRLYYIKESNPVVPDTNNSDSQLQELLLPNSGTEVGYLY